MGAIYEHYGAIEADWLRYYNRNLSTDLWGTDPIGMRKLKNYLIHLPLNSNFRKATNTHWSDMDAMVAIGVELLDAQRREFLAVNTKEGTELPTPLRLPRPWDTVDTSKKEFGTTQAGFKDMVGDLLEIKVEE